MSRARGTLLEFLQVAGKALTRKLPDAAGNFDDSVLDSDRDTRNFGYLVLCSLLGGFILWAGIAPLESAVRGQGTVRVEGNSKPIQHFEGGIVSQILVESGDYVRENQPLIMLDATQAEAEQRIIEGKLWTKRALVDRLISERDDLELVVFQPWLEGELDERAQLAIQSELALFATRRADRLGEIKVLEQRIAQLERQISGTRSVVIAKEQVAASLRNEKEDLEILLKDGYVDTQRIRQLERSLAESLGELADLNAQIAAAMVAIEETRLNILQLNKRFKTQVVDSLTKAQEDFFDMQQRLLVVNDRLARMVITAPASGFVLGLQPNVVGAVVRAGEELMAIVPDIDKLIIDVQLSPMDMDRISIGQDAEVRFAVFKDAYTVTGRLIKVSADSLTDKISGLPYFEAKVELDPEDVGLLKGYTLIPGMPADVLIKTGSRTFIGYLTSPLQRMFENSLIED